MKNEFIEKIKPLIETNDSCLYSLLQSNFRVIKNSGEADFLNSLINKYLVVERLGRKCFYGKIQKVKTRISLDSERLKCRYTMEITYQSRKDSRQSSIAYVNLLNCDFETFDTEEQAINYINK
jgi:hypothetical protein